MTIITMLDAKKRKNELYNEQTNQVSTWSEITEYFCPERGKYNTTHKTKVEVDRKKIINQTPVKCVEEYANGILSGMTSESRSWFKIGLEGVQDLEAESTKEYFNDIENIYYAIFSKSKFYDCARNLYAESGAFGDGAIFTEYDYKNIVKFQTFTAGEYAFTRDSNGDVDSFSRVFPMTISSIVDEFGYDNCSVATRIAYDNKNYLVYTNVCHLIDKNKKRDVMKKDNLNFKFYSCYWEENANEDKFLRQSGYKTMPIAVLSINKITSDTHYGYGIANSSLGDAKQLQKLETEKLINISLINKPPTQSHIDSNPVLNTLPGGHTYYDGSMQDSGIRPAYQVPIQLQPIAEEIKIVEQRIKDAFFIDLFRMFSSLDRQGITATEIRSRMGEKLDRLSPVLGSIKNQFLDPIFDRIFEIIMDAGLIPPAPEELQGRELKIDYISPLYQAREMIETTAIEQLFAFAGSISQVFPDSIDNIDSDKAISLYAEHLGVEDIIKVKKQVEQERKEKMDAMAMQQQRQDAMEAIQGAKTMSETPIQDNTALTAMLSGMGEY